MKKSIKVGVIGTGFIGPVHIEAVRRLGIAEVVAVAESDLKKAQEKAEELNIPKAYGDYKELLNDPEIDVVHICSPNNLHYTMAKEALLAGKHVMCEKPITLSVSETEELIQIAKEKKLAHGMHYNVRFYPLVVQVSEMVKNGDLGEIFAVNGSYQQDWLFYETDYSWRINPEISGESRAVSDIGSHWLDTLEFMLQNPITSVYSDFATFYPVRKKPLVNIETYSGKVLEPGDYEEVPVKTEDYATVLLRFRNGAHGSMTVNQVAAGRKNRICFEIYGSKMSVAFNSESPNELWIGHRDKSNELMIRDPSIIYGDVRKCSFLPGGHNEGYADATKCVMKLFYEYIASQGYLTDEKPLFATFEDGLRDQQLCEGILESSKKQTWISL